MVYREKVEASTMMWEIAIGVALGLVLYYYVLDPLLRWMREVISRNRVRAIRFVVRSAVLVMAFALLVALVWGYLTAGSRYPFEHIHVVEAVLLGTAVVLVVLRALWKAVG
jgi:hypothetical protein